MTCTVLVVEDEVIVANDMVEILRDGGHDVLEPAHTVEEARRRFREKDVDLVILDVNLEGDNEGLGLAREWDEEAEVVFVSAYLDEGTLEEARTTGALGYLAKPTTEDQLRTVGNWGDGTGDPSTLSLRRGEIFSERSRHS